MLEDQHNTLEQYKRSNEPIFWGLFGFGGMVIAFAVPALLVCMILAGVTESFEHFNIVSVLNHWWGAAAVFLIVLGILFHCVHRIYFSLHDVKLKPGVVGQVILYGFATLLTLAVGAALAKIVFLG